MELDLKNIDIVDDLGKVVGTTNRRKRQHTNGQLVFKNERDVDYDGRTCGQPHEFMREK